MHTLTLGDLTGQVLADRYRLEARQATGLLSAVFLATDLAPDAEPATVLVQLRRPWGGAEQADAAPPVELHDLQLLGAGFTAEVFLVGDVEIASGATGEAAAAWLVARGDAVLPAADPDSTSPGLPVPWEQQEIDPAWLAAADHDALAAAIDDALEDAEADSTPEGTLDGTDFDAAALGADLPPEAECEDASGLEAVDLTDIGLADLVAEEPRNGVQDTAMEMPVLTFDGPARPREG
jgi:hypothetical protein